ncbi:AAA family ATPase [Nocardioides currus]|uniref:AAA family ATPase n=1 Tax=Nocardioides currus TaxID=2133958 RepID=UPI0014021ACD|nr:AAA family ATPase [Nocardioides currus]
MLVQLSGVPGSGKSTLAYEIANTADYVVVNTDVLKSCLLGSGVPMSDAGGASYAVALGLSSDLVAQGRSVILDSPCRYRELLDGGESIAEAAGIRYAFIELWAPDVSVLLTRLDEREPRISQVASATAPVPGTAWEFGTAEATLSEWQEQLLRPDGDWIRLNATHPREANLERALEYLEHRRP